MELKNALAMSNGYDHVIDYTSTDFETEVMRLTDGQGVDVAYDSVGNDTMARTITSTKRHGTIIAFGQSSGPYVDFKITDLAKGSYYLSRQPVSFCCGPCVVGNGFANYSRWYPMGRSRY